MKCIPNSNGSKCCLSKINGYIFNSESENSNDFIYCNNLKCVTKTIDNGFLLSYSTTNNNIVLCESSNCRFYNPGTSCINNNNKIILINGEPIYCLNNNEFYLTNKSKYYELSNVNANSVYPNVSQGNSTILLEINQYSITQYYSPSSNSNFLNHLYLLIILIVNLY